MNSIADLPNPILGAATLLSAASLYVVAYRAARGGRWRRALLWIVAAGAVLRAYDASDLFLHSWDERFHVLVAKHLIEHPLVPTLIEDPVRPYDPGEWLANHVWLHKPPFALWLMALSMRIFGVNEIAARLPSLLLSTLAILLTYGIGVRLFGPREGLIAAFLHSLNGFLIALSSGRSATDHVDTVFIVLIELGIWLAVRCRDEPRLPAMALVGVVTGCAILTKWYMGGLVIAVAAGLLLSRHPWPRVIVPLGAATLAAALTFVPWQAYVAHAFPVESAAGRQYFLRYLSEPMGGHAGGWLTHVSQIPRLFGELAFIPLAWFLARVLPSRARDLGALAAWFAIPYAVFSIAATKMTAYVLIAAPAVFLMIAAGTRDLAATRFLTTRPRLRAIALVFILLLPLRLTIEKVELFKPYDRCPAWARELRALRGVIGTGPSVLFNEERPIEAMFYLPCTAYQGFPSEEEIERLTDRGYAVFLREAPDVPEFLLRDPRVTLVGE